MSSWYFSPSAARWTSAMSSEDALSFHRELPGYEPTPLVSVPALADELGVGRVLVKDESSRLGLPAFKILGASWACRQVVAAQPGVMLVAATDGNHGRAVARMARHLGVRAAIFVPRIMLPQTAALIESEGADLVWVDGDYDSAVRCAADFAEVAPGRALVQDMAWPGYEQVPAWIVEGYQTMLAEIDAHLDDALDLVIVPVGVGALAEAVVRHYRRKGGRRPRLMSVEPTTANCLLISLVAGRSVTVTTGATVMAGLNCGTVSASAWPVLQSGLDAAVAVADEDALRAVDDLAAAGISSGPSGAATLAGLRVALGRDAPPERRQALRLGQDAVVVLLSTEANTTAANDRG
jgi:diaminopropionate ammonia-lyase